MFAIQTLAVILGVGVGYVLAPVALSIYAQYRKPRELKCPENECQVMVTVDARYAAMTAMAGAKRLRLADCSRWPEKAGCDQACVKQLL